MLAPLVGLVVPLVLDVVAAAIAPAVAAPPAEPDAAGPLAGLAIVLLGAAVELIAGLLAPPIPALALGLWLALVALGLPVLGAVLGSLEVAGGSAPPQADTPSATSKGSEWWRRRY